MFDLEEETRSIPEIFSSLEELTQTEGYIHVIAYLCFRDNTVTVAPFVMPKSFERLRSENRLIRPELTTLIGLMIKKEVIYKRPSLKGFTEQVNATESLLEELHESLNLPMLQSMFNPDGTVASDPFSSAAALREPIFYTGESAYSFQHLDFASQKYSADDDWLLENKQFKIGSAVLIAKAISQIINTRLSDAVELSAKNPENVPQFLFGHTFHKTEIIKETGLSPEIVNAVLTAFTIPDAPSNETFNDIGDFNLYKSAPLLKAPDGLYICLQEYILTEAIYETPFYWMMADKSYRNNVAQNRGEFCENVIADRFSDIFGADNVYKNLIFADAKGKTAGEIDVLVTLEDHALIIQAKSKRLTLAAQKGNDQALKKDFKGAIQHACDQGYDCADLIIDESIKITDGEGNPVQLRRDFKEVGVMCVVSDHYPSLSIQARHLLKDYDRGQLPPFIADIFFIDVLCEFLNEPHRLFHFLWKRMSYFMKVRSNSEISNLAYHLKNNLWFDELEGIAVLDDSHAAEIDAAFMCRRLGFEGETVPDGILTHYLGTRYDDLLQHTCSSNQDGMVDLSAFLLDLSEESVNLVNDGLERLETLFKSDGRSHDFVFVSEDTGFIIHIVETDNTSATKRLTKHCLRKKYETRSEKWFGLLKVANSQSFFSQATFFNKKWKYNSSRENERKRQPLKPTYNLMPNKI